MKKHLFLWLAVVAGVSFVTFAASVSAEQNKLPAKNAGKEGGLGRRPTYICRMLTAKISIDGKLDEGDWRRADEIQLSDNSGKGKLRPKTTAKMLWDEQNLYIGFVAEDADIHATMKKRDDHLWTEEVVEVFVGAADIYLEIEVNPLNTLFDAVIDLRGQKGRPRFDVEAAAKADFQIEHQVVVEGTLDKRTDADERWVAEVAIPHAAMKGIQSVPPRDGDAWRINLYRIDRSVEGGKERTASGAWSPTGGWFHNPLRFGKIVFRAGQ